MNEDRPTTSPAPVGVGSTDWRATAAGEHTEELAAFLERLSALPIARQAIEQTLAFLRLTPGQRVLEVGCGNGVFLPLLAAAVGPQGQVEGIDHAQEFVAAAQERVDASGHAAVVTVREADAYRLPFPDATFDAAHCERVLFHLDDPTAALREMRRVVKPGGRVVAAEPDWLGRQIDHPDHEAMALLYERYCTRTFRQPRMGLTLNRRMHEAGLERREIVPLISTGTAYSELTQYGFDPTAAAAELVAEGRMTRERMDAVFAAIDAASADGSFWTYGAYMIGAGQVPG